MNKMNKEELYNKFNTETSSDLLNYRKDIVNIYNELENIKERHNLILDYVIHVNPSFNVVKDKYNSLDNIVQKDKIIRELIKLWKL